MAKKTKSSNLSIDERLEQALISEENEPYKLPDNWCWIRLGSINSYAGRSVDPAGAPSDIFELYSVPSSADNYPEIVAGDEIGSTKQVVEKEDVLLCKINPRINRVWKVAKHTEFTLLASSEWIIIRNKGIASDYLMWCLRSPYFREFMLSNVSGIGGSLMRAQPKHVQNYPIPLPPAPEQKRIVERLESLFAKLDEAKEKVQEVADGFETRKATILQSAFSGALTAKWRNENDVPSEDWQKVKLGHLLKEIKYGTSEKSDYAFGGIPVLRIPNIGEMELIFDDVKQLQRYHCEPNEYLQENDILIIRSNGSKDLVGKCALVRNLDREYTYASFLIRLRAVEDVSAEYLVWYLNSEDARRQLFGKAKSSAGIHNINSKEIADLDIIIPSITEQDEVVRILSNLIDKERRVRETTNAMIEQIDSMKKAILTRAFCGQLGTNDPAEESAKELLRKLL